MDDSGTRAQLALKSDSLESYDKTEIGSLPEDWTIATLGDLAVVKQGKTPKKSQYLDHGRYKVLKVRDINQNGFVDWGVNKEGLVNEDLGVGNRVQHGDALILSAAHSPKIVGTKIGFVQSLPDKVDAVFHVAELIKVRAKDTTTVDDPYFLFAVLSSDSTREQVRGMVKGGHLYASTLANLCVSLPPLSEQRAIAHVLRTVQEAKVVTEKVIEATRQLKRSLMNHLFTYGPVPVDEAERVPLKETEIGLVPEKWDLVRVADLFEWQLGKMLSPAAKKGVSPRPYLRNLNVQWGRVDVRKLVEMDFTEKERAKFSLKEGDILVCEGGEVGRTAIWRDEIGECYFQKAVHRLRPRDERMAPEFFLYHMMNAFLLRQSYGVVGTDTTIAHLPGIKLKALEIPLTSRDEQDEIVRVLGGVDEKIAAEENRKRTLEVLFKTLLHNLMTGKVRVTDLDLSKAGELV